MHDLLGFLFSRVGHVHHVTAETGKSCTTRTAHSDRTMDFGNFGIKKSRNDQNRPPNDQQRPERDYDRDRKAPMRRNDQSDQRDNDPVAAKRCAYGPTDDRKHSRLI